MQGYRGHIRWKPPSNQHFQWLLSLEIKLTNPFLSWAGILFGVSHQVLHVLSQPLLVLVCIVPVRIRKPYFPEVISNSDSYNLSTSSSTVEPWGGWSVVWPVVKADGAGNKRSEWSENHCCLSYVDPTFKSLHMCFSIEVHTSYGYLIFPIISGNYFCKNFKVFGMIIPVYVEPCLQWNTLPWH